MTRFAPTITNHPDEDLTVHVTIPGKKEATYRFKTQESANHTIAEFEPQGPHSTRITTDSDQLRRVLAPATEIAHRTSEVPALNTIRIHSLEDGTTRLSATDRFIVMRGKLHAPVLGEPVDLAIRAGEAQIILDLLGDTPEPVDHCEACVESGFVDACWREHRTPSPVILDIGPGTVRVTIGSHYKTSISFDTCDPSETLKKLDPLVDELTKPAQLNATGYACNPLLVPECEGIILAPRITNGGEIRWGIVDRRHHLFDGVLMPILEEEES